MKPENLGLRYIHKYAPDAQPIETDLMGAAFAIPSYAEIAAKMSVEERNKMRELGWWKDFQLDHWVFITDYHRGEVEEREEKVVIKQAATEPAKTSAIPVAQIDSNFP